MTRKLVPPIVALVVVLAAWEIGVRALAIQAFLLPPPSAIAAALVEQRADLAKAFLVTAKAALLGFASSAAIGVAAGFTLASSRPLERALYPYTVFLQTVPIVAIAPLLVVWFGPGLTAVTLAAIIVSVFPVVANTLAGVRSVDPALLDLFRLYGASRAARLVKLEFPAALPSIFTGLRVAAGLAVIGTIVGEFVAGFAEGDAGLGIKIMTAYRQLKTDQLFAAVILAAMLGLALFALVSVTSSRALRRWHASEKPRD